MGRIDEVGSRLVLPSLVIVMGNHARVFNISDDEKNESTIMG